MRGPHHRHPPPRCATQLALADPLALAHRQQRRHPRHRAGMPKPRAVNPAGAYVAAIRADRSPTRGGDCDNAPARIKGTYHQAGASETRDVRIGHAAREPQRQTQRLHTRDLKPRQPLQRLQAPRPRPTRHTAPAAHHAPSHGRRLNPPRAPQPPRRCARHRVPLRSGLSRPLPWPLPLQLLLLFCFLCLPDPLLVHHPARPLIPRPPTDPAKTNGSADGRYGIHSVVKSVAPYPRDSVAEPAPRDTIASSMTADCSWLR